MKKIRGGDKERGEEMVGDKEGMDKDRNYWKKKKGMKGNVMKRVEKQNHEETNSGKRKGDKQRR